MNIIQSEQNLKCKKHQMKDIEFIQVNELNNENLFYCSTCINEDLSFKGINYLLIQQIKDQGTSHIIQKWPPVNDYDIIKKLIEQTSLDTQLSIVQQITNYFNNLREDIQRKLEICQKNMINNVLQQPLDREQIIKQYQDISSLPQLRQILFDVDQDTLFTKQQECQIFIQQIESQKDKNTQLLQNLLTKCQNIQNLINFEYHNAIKQTILTYIDEINFFNQQITQNNQSSQQDNHNMDKIEVVMNLISNKSNYCSDQFLSSLKQQIKILNPILEYLSFNNIFKENKKPIDFSQINTDQLNLISEYVNHLALLKSDSNEYKNQVKSSIKLKEINNIINNKLNFTDPSYNQQFDNFLIDQYPFLDKLDFSLIFKDRNKFDFFRDLSDDVINELFIQTQRRKYQPIDVQLLKSNFNNTLKNINININENGKQEIQIQKNTGQWITCISDLILEKDKKYIFRIKIGILEKDLNIFGIGLMENSKIDNSNGNECYLCCYLQSENNLISKRSDFGIQKQLKGKGFNLSNDNIIEMRVCLKDYILEVLDYPNYNFKLGLADERKQNLLNYKDLRLYISAIQSNIKFTLINSQTVNDFTD